MKHLTKILSTLALLSVVTLSSCGRSDSPSSTPSGGGGTSGDPTTSGGGGESQGLVLPDIDYVKVFAPKDSYNKVYAWVVENNKTVELCGSWSGTAMVDAEDYGTTTKWMTYDFRGRSSVNFIFTKDGANQTDDLLADKPGYYWYLNNKVEYTNIVPGTGSGGDTSTSTGDVSIPEGDYDFVPDAKYASELPAVKNYNKGKVVHPYTGSRTDFRDESIYFTITTRFYDGDTSNNTVCWDRKNDTDDPAWRGDFKGLIQKMDYIKALGFTAIWITPVVKNASGYDYHGYHAINFKEVDPRYLSEDVDFEKVIEEAHKRDMKIVLDVVFNHTCNFGEENLFPMFYYDNAHDTTINGIHRNTTSGLLPASYDSMDGNNQYQTRINTMKNDSSDTAHIYHHEKSMGYEEYIEQTGQMAGDCVDLNTENPTVANYLIEAMGEFIRLGVDAFRIDTMKHISRLTFNNYIWPGLYAIAEKCENKNFFMFGEVCTRYRQVWNAGHPCDSAPFYTWKESKTYSWGDRVTNEASTLQNWNDNYSNPNSQPTSNNHKLNGSYTYHAPDHSKFSGCGVIDFPMHWNFQHASDAYGVATGNDQYYNDATYNVVYVDSHDYGPDGQEKYRYKGSVAEWKENLNIMYTLRGIPCLYYGDEIQFVNDMEIDVGPNKPLSQTGRAYFGDKIEGTVTATGFGSYSASGTVNSTLGHELATHIRKLNKARLLVPALRRGQYQTGNGMTYVKRYTAGGIDSVAVVAVSSSGSFSGLPSGEYIELFSGNRQTGSSITLSAGGQGNIQIWVLNNGASNGTLGKLS